MRKKIFVISGLGADSSMFKHLVFEQIDLVHITWVQPTKVDSLTTYAKKLLPQITTHQPIILGLSLGGMIAYEIGRLIETEAIISLSSISDKKELPFHYKVAGVLRLNKLVPLHWLCKSNCVTNWLFGATQKETKQHLKNTLNQIDPYFLKWAIAAVLSWKSEKISKKPYRIHGTKDLILPLCSRSSYYVVINGGGHLMVLEQSEAIKNSIEQLILTELT